MHETNDQNTTENDKPTLDHQNNATVVEEDKKEPKINITEQQTTTTDKETNHNTQNETQNHKNNTTNKSESMDLDQDTKDDSQDVEMNENDNDTDDDQDSNSKSEQANEDESNHNATNGDQNRMAMTSNITTTTESNTNTASPPPPVLKGTLSYNMELGKHLIRGMWNYENSNVFPPQRFELLRNLGPDEDPKLMPKDGEFHGSFSLAYFHTTSKGKQKERSRVIPETNVNIKFTKINDETGEYKVDGKGLNQFGVFHINGTATPSHVPDDPTYHVVMRKRYEPSTTTTPTAANQTIKPTNSGKSITNTSEGDTDGPLPPPSQSYPSGVVCLRGKLLKEESFDLGVTEVVQRIKGYWATGLDLIEADPENTRELQSKFEYEHKTSASGLSVPVSGRYSGWFDIRNELDGSTNKIVEKDVILKFKKNSAGYHNVEGKGSNAFGKYNITGTLSNDNILTIFRHFMPRKIKASTKGVTSAPGPINEPQARRTSMSSVAPENRLKLEDVKVPSPKEGESTIEPFQLPANGTYSAVSRGVLRLNEDGSHSCQGKWAVTREHFTNNQTSNFTLRLESHFAKEGTSSEESNFPMDSANYKGSFQLKKSGSRYQTIVDDQVVIKFAKNSQGSFNVYGKGMNAIGEFILTGTLVMSGKTGGQVELYRMYPPDRLAVPPVPPKQVADKTPSARVPPPPEKMQRRESTRVVKLPSKLEDDDPSALMNRVMDKCSSILRNLRERDLALGGHFSEPVDPVALGIPTYHQIIKEPMDLKTINRKMESGEVKTPEEFARLCRLVFENAMTFNLDPAHVVHQSAKQLMSIFIQKFRDVDRIIQKAQGEGGDVKRRRREKSLRKKRFDEAAEMAVENSKSLSAIYAAAPTSANDTVSRAEFSAMLQMLQNLSNQIVQTHNALAELCPGDENDSERVPMASVATSGGNSVSGSSYVAPPKKKSTKRKAERIAEEEYVPVYEDDHLPLTLEEQELLTETINQLQPEQLGGVIQIIREAAPVGADEDEIDLEIDQLDTSTQRKLLRHVMKFVKKKGKKKPKTSQSSQPRAAEKSLPGAKKSATKSKASSTTESFFAFGDGSDSDSDDNNGAGTKSNDDFKLADGLGDLGDDHDEEFTSGAANWNITSNTDDADKKAADDDDAWGAVREEAAAAKAREAERKAREEKIQAEAEQAKSQRLAEAVAKGEEIKAQRAEDEANEASLREQEEKEAEEARKAAREAARAQVQSVERTVDLDAQRDIMKQYEQSFLDKDLGGASPSSDFGF